MIIFFLGGISSAIREIWGFVQSGVTRGLSAIETFTDIVSGGYDIQKEDFAGHYDLAEQARESWGKLNLLPPGYKVSEEFAIASPFDWREKYVMKVNILARDLQTGEFIEQWITVESDEELSKAEWNFYAQQAVTDSPIGYSLDIFGFNDYEYYVRN